MALGIEVGKLRSQVMSGDYITSLAHLALHDEFVTYKIPSEGAKWVFQWLNC